MDFDLLDKLNLLQNSRCWCFAFRQLFLFISCQLSSSSKPCVLVPTVLWSAARIMVLHSNLSCASYSSLAQRTLFGWKQVDVSSYLDLHHFSHGDQLFLCARACVYIYSSQQIEHLYDGFVVYDKFQYCPPPIGQGKWRVECQEELQSVWFYGLFASSWFQK